MGNEIFFIVNDKGCECCNDCGDFSFWSGQNEVSGVFSTLPEAISALKYCYDSDGGFYEGGGGNVYMARLGQIEEPILICEGSIKNNEPKLDIYETKLFEEFTSSNKVDLDEKLSSVDSDIGSGKSGHAIDELGI